MLLTTTSRSAYLSEDISAQLLATCITFLVLETVFIILLWTSRYYAKKERSNSAMEVFITMAWLVCCVKITVVILLIKLGGTGHHTIALDPETRKTALKLSTANQVLCPLTTSLSKLGILCFLDRILRQSGRWYRVSIRSTFILVLVIMLAQFLTPFINCRPFRKTWEPQTPGRCAIKSLQLWRYAGIPNMFATLIVVGIPVPALARLQVSRHVKFGLGVVFGVCIAGVVAAFMRIYSFWKVDDFHDIAYENVKPLCWIVAESGIYLIAGVMLTLRPLLRKVCEGTVLEAIWTRRSGSRRSWERRKFGRGLNENQQQVVLPTIKKQPSLSENTAGRTVLARAEVRIVYRPNERWN